MRAPRGDETDEEEDKRLGVLCENKKQTRKGEKVEAKEKIKEEEDLEIMTNWLEFKIGEDETLRCFSCSKFLHGQSVHLYLNVNNELDEVLCEACLRKIKKRKKSNGRTIP